MSFSKNLKYLRKKSGKTQDEFGSELNIGRTTVANYEAGISEPNMETLVRFAHYFGVSLDDFMSTNMDSVQAESKAIGSSIEKDALLRGAFPQKAGTTIYYMCR